MKVSEDVNTEFKREYTNNINKTIIAFANTDGGILHIGIADDGSVVGIKDINNTQLQISNTIRDSIKPDISMFIRTKVEKLNNKKVIKIIVQKGTMCPYYLAGKGIRPEGVYIRQGASTVPASETAILRMIKETDGESFETVRSLNQELTFQETKKEFEVRDLAFGITQQKTLGIINANGMYTNLGLLLSDQCIHSVKLAVFKGTVKAEFKDRREFIGSIFNQINNAFEFIDRYNGNRSEVKGLLRTDRRDYPIEAIREALLNALVHRDYSFSDSTIISIFDDRMEFISIGGLVTGITYDDIMLGVSVARNHNLANIFYRLSLIEAYGTGIPKILRSYNEKIVKPQIQVSENVFKVTLPNINTEAANLLLTENEKSVLKILSEKEIITRKDVEIMLAISQTMAVKVLSGLVNKKMIHVVDKGKNTKYIL